MGEKRRLFKILRLLTALCERNENIEESDTRATTNESQPISLLMFQTRQQPNNKIEFGTQSCKF